MNLICWWLGHKRNLLVPIKRARCVRCAELMTYYDCVATSRSSLAAHWLRFWLYRRWFPEKCKECGKRYGHKTDCDELPF